MLNRHLLYPAAAAAVVLISLSGCAPAGGDDSSEGIRIAAVYENTSDAFWGSYMCGGQAKADELGVTLEVTSQATADSSKLATALDTALLTEPDAVILNPTDPAPWSTKIASLMDSGLAVSTVQNFDAIPTEYSYSQADDSGAPFVDQVLALVGEDVSGTAVTLLGLADAPWQNNRLDAITAAVKDANPGLRFLDPLVDGFDVNKGTQLVSSVITANPDVRLILSPAGPEGQAIAAAVKQTGATGITVISFDAVPAEVEALRDGTIQMLIAQPAYALGEAQVQQLVDYLRGDTFAAGEAVEAQSGEPSVLSVGVLTKDNVDDAESQQYIYNADC